MNFSVRSFRPEDLATIKQLTVDAFEGVSLEQDIESALGILNDRDWRWRKARHIDEDVSADADGIFVAERGSEILGYITTRIDREAGKGRIPNLAVDVNHRGHRIGRRLIQHALDYFRSAGLQYAVIETMAQNDVGQHLYPACGFIEVGRQVHYARKL